MMLHHTVLYRADKKIQGLLVNTLLLLHLDAKMVCDSFVG